MREERGLFPLLEGTQMKARNLLESEETNRLTINEAQLVAHPVVCTSAFLWKKLKTAYPHIVSIGGYVILPPATTDIPFLSGFRFSIPWSGAVCLDFCVLFLISFDLAVVCQLAIWCRFI